MIEEFDNFKKAWDQFVIELSKALYLDKIVEWLNNLLSR